MTWPDKPLKPTTIGTAPRRKCFRDWSFSGAWILALGAFK